MDTLTPSAWASTILTHHPRATNNFQSGLYRMDKQKALKKIHVDPNSEWATGTLTFDVDADDAAEMVLTLVYDEESIPKPSFITTNKASTHCHLGYLLETPVLKTSNAHSAPLDYLADIQRTITNRIPDADRGYTAPTTRNPLHEDQHKVLWGPAKPYSLGELKEGLGGKLDRPSMVVSEVGLGRNVALFQALRTWSYSQFHKHERMDTFEKAIWAQAVAMNAVSFEAPLSGLELKAIARSITNWTWRNFTANARTTRYSDTQRARAMRRTAYIEKQNGLAILREDAENGLVPTAKEVEERFGISRATAYNWLRELGLVEPRTIEDRIPEVMALKEQRFTNVVIADKLGLTPRQVGYAVKKGKEAIG